MMPDTLSAAFIALGDPTRRAMLGRLAGGPATVKELSEPFALSPAAITKHLKMLERGGLIRRSRDRQRRPAEIEPAAFREVAGWLEQYRPFWDESFDRLGELLDDLQKGNGK